MAARVKGSGSKLRCKRIDVGSRGTLFFGNFFTGGKWGMAPGSGGIFGSTDSTGSASFKTVGSASFKTVGSASFETVGSASFKSDGKLCRGAMGAVSGGALGGSITTAFGTCLSRSTCFGVTVFGWGVTAGLETLGGAVTCGGAVTRGLTITVDDVDRSRELQSAAPQSESA